MTEDAWDETKAATWSTLHHKLLSEEFEKEETVWIAKSRAALDVWLVLLAVSSNLHDDGKYLLLMPATGWQYLDSDASNGEVKPEIGHIDLPAVKSNYPGSI